MLKALLIGTATLSLMGAAAQAQVAPDRVTLGSGGSQPAVGNPGASQQAKQAGDKQGGAQMAAMAMAAMMAAMCQPQNPIPCVLSALAAAQGGGLGDNQDGSYQSAGQFATGNYGGSTNGTIAKPTPPGVGTPGGGVKIDKKIQADLASKGVTLSPDGKQMTLPNGQTVPLTASSATEAGQKALGFSDSQIAAGKSALLEAQSKVGSGIKATGADLGGGAAVAAAVPGGEGGGGGSSRPNPKDVKLTGGKKASLSGMSKNLGNDKIGVSADNIFEMITRRYKAKDQTDTFIKN